MMTERYVEQRDRWPTSGRHILAQYDDATVVVYQAYRPEIGCFAAEHGYFGGAFSFGRMSWVKPNFLWMMYRSGWGTKPDHEVTLAVTLRRDAFNAILAAAVHSSFAPAAYETHGAWRAALNASDVRLQWDPDHDPDGRPLERRAIQLGLRGDALRRFGREWIVRVDNVSAFVVEQREALRTRGPGALVTPSERVHPVEDAAVAKRLGLDKLN